MYRANVLCSLLVAAIVLGSSGAAVARAGNGGIRGWSGRGLYGRGAVPVPERPESDDAAAAQAKSGQADASANAKGKSLTGTWRVEIPTSDGGLPPFRAYQTFSDDGTFTEVSSLLTTDTESPAHGVWSGKKSAFQLTFELFAFDSETKQAVGRIRVRCDITLSADGDRFDAVSVVDFIGLDGEVIAGIDSGPFSGTRVKVVPPSGS